MHSYIFPAPSTIYLYESTHSLSITITKKLKSIYNPQHTSTDIPVKGDQTTTVSPKIIKMKAMDEKKETEKGKPVTIKAAIRDEEGHKKVEKVELEAHKVDTLKYVEKKLVDKGVQRMERHPADGLPFARPPPKSGHGGKYTWEGPADEAENELDPAPPAIDEKDPNYVDEEVEEEVVKEVDGVVVGVVEVPKAAKEGVARIEIDPHLKVV